MQPRGFSPFAFAFGDGGRQPDEKARRCGERIVESAPVSLLSAFNLSTFLRHPIRPSFSSTFQNSANQSSGENMPSLLKNACKHDEQVELIRTC